MQNNIMQMNVAGVRRNLKNLAHNYTDAQKKVREATSNDPWGPSCTLMAEIADLTYNVMAFSEIMSMIWKRLNDHGKNWRHVYKALTLLEYLIKTGSEKVLQQCKENFYVIQTLKDFQHYEEMKDQGVNVREKAKALVILLKDEEKLKCERAKALKAKERFAQSGTGFGSDGVVETITFTPPTSPTGRVASGAWSGTPDRAGRSSAEINREIESARPQTVGEEELQLQLALAMSREEAEQEEQRRKSDDVRLQLALSQSQHELKPISSPPNEGGSNLLDLLDVNLGAAASVPASSPHTDAWGMPKRPQVIDPWGGVSSSATNPAPPPNPWQPSPAQRAPLQAVPPDPWHSGAVPRPPVQAAPPDPWAPPQPSSHSPTVPVQAPADPWAPPRATDAWTPVNRLSPALPMSDPWKAVPATADPWSPTTDHSPLSPMGAGDEFDIISNRDRQANNINNNGVTSPDAFDLSGLADSLSDKPMAKKSAQAFLGENSALVNLENLVSAPKPVMAPTTAFASNPFGSGPAPAPNLFQQQVPPRPTLNQLNQMVRRDGSPASPPNPFLS